MEFKGVQPHDTKYETFLSDLSLSAGSIITQGSANFRILKKMSAVLLTK